ncbi:FHA domain-containing protein [Synechococcales cyanobacterium C]|uniref:FHA domain-containing protein n=1 Tax=Petrachloros mirabilis ULC683 TaxID=2781853 RepID=A0A8K1ZW47_9CYAN|nr:FHA domain-containing protein [Petrachloros mirabilis]NCJ05221.1 FHA domain-containing protein [Petrachloros mirabilis ULC683]
MSGSSPDCQERHLLVINDGQRRAIALEAAAYSIGRDPSNAIALDFDTISRQHAIFLRMPIPGTHRYRYRVMDGNAEGKPSANGVYVNGECCKSHDLKNGDTISFGRKIQASYLTVSMSKSEFVNYLDSIAYQSIKSHLVDSKATLVSMDEVNLDDVILPPRRVAMATLGDTVHEVDNQSLVSPKGTVSSGTHATGKAGLRASLMIVPVAAISVSALAWFGIQILNSTPDPKPAPQAYHTHFL